jgi:hypothetical protein
VLLDFYSFPGGLNLYAMQRGAWELVGLEEVNMKAQFSRIPEL